jgi:Iron-containing redox enzyme
MTELKTVSPFFVSYGTQTSLYERPLSYRGPLAETIKQLTLSKNVGPYFAEHGDELAHLLSLVEAAGRRAYHELDEESMGQIQRSLFNIYEQFIGQPVPDCEMNGLNWVVSRIKTTMEDAWIGYELRRSRDVAGTGGAMDNDIGDRIRTSIRSHPSHDHRLFAFLQHEATREEIYHYFVSDYPLNVKFYDLVALSLVGGDPVTRIETASNLWDEVGRGDAARTHLQLYSNVLLELGLEARAERIASQMSRAALAGYNLLLCLALNRDQYFRLIGALGVTELADPDQYKKLLAGCARVGLKQTRDNLLAFYDEHIEIDSTHGDGWVRNVIRPIVTKYPAAAPAVLEGCGLRLNTAQDYWDSLMGEMRRRRDVGLG